MTTNFGGRLLVLVVFVLLGLPLASCRNKVESGVDQEVSTLGTVEVTARLLEIPGQFPPNDLYNYAYVLKYHVRKIHRGTVSGEQIFVAQYNPLKPRSAAQDENSGKLGGHLQSFKVGEVHRMALEFPVEEHWMGGIIDKYFEQKGVRYWAVWTNLAQQ